MKKLYLILGFLLSISHQTYSQCGPNTPQFIVDLSADPNGQWTSPWTDRDDTCCTIFDNCVEFIVTLHPLAEGLLFDVCGGALPPGALFYQIDCGIPTAIGDAICLFGVGPFSITFCKPGSNLNKFCITAVAEPGVGNDLTIAEGCYDSISTVGFEPTSLLWRSVFPGAIGAYNSYLDCTFDCEDVVVTPDNNPPPYVDYQVCGFALGLCDTTGLCDTVRVFFNDSLDISIMPENPTVCFGDNTTNIYGVPSGGESPFHYSWNTGDTTQAIDVGIGTYSVIVSDEGGCYTATSSITVTEYLQVITADAGLDELFCNESPVVQLDGVVTGVSTGVWIGGDGIFLPDSTNLNAVYYPTTNEITNGSSTLTLLTTNNGTCPPDSNTVTINYVGFDGTISTFSDSLLCYQDINGGASVVVSGGYDDTYTYLWNDALASTTPTLTNIQAGSYTVIITDSLSCDSTVTVEVFGPEELVIDSIGIQDLACFNDSSGQASLFLSGGIIPYSYNWGANANNQSNATAINLASAVYNPIITDAKGCTVDTIISISEPSQLLLSIDDITSLLCYADSNGTAAVSASGGTPSYIYQWDASTSSQTGNTATNLSVGNYSVQVSDANSCIDTIEVFIDEPSELFSVAGSLEDVSCFGGANGSTEVLVDGGVAPYTYLWDATAQDQTTSIAINLEAGLYSVLVIDTNGCSSLSQVTISEPDSALFLEMDVQAVDCFGAENGILTVNAYGATSPYTYLWDTNAGGQTTASVNDLATGSYWVWVTDINNCIDSAVATVSEPSVLLVQSTSFEALCFGSEDGYSILNVAGGIPPYNYQWDANADSQTDSIATNLAVGNYGYVVEDSNNCVDSGSVYIDAPIEITIEASEDQSVCYGANVNVSAQATGGTGELTYYWFDFGQGQTQSFTVVDNDCYLVLAIDTLGCISLFDSVEVTVMNINTDTLITFNTGDVCLGESTSISAQFSGQNDSYTYYWNNNLGATFGPLAVSPIIDTWYTFIVIDECSNSLSDSTLVEIYPLPENDVSISANEGCEPLEVTFENSAATGVYSYVWLFGDGGGSSEANPEYIYEEAGVFLVELTVFSSFGCSSNSSNNHFVTVYAKPVSDFNANPWETDITESQIEFTNTSSSDAIFFTWDFGDGDSLMVENPTHTYLEIGEYIVTLETENVKGCISSVSKTVIINLNHDIIVPNAFTPNGNGSNGGAYDPHDLSNDIFYPFVNYISTYHMMIFNRWGELIFESNDVLVGWDGYYDGKLSQIGTYVYTIDITFIDDFSASKQGHIKLIR